MQPKTPLFTSDSQRPPRFGHAVYLGGSEVKSKFFITSRIKQALSIKSLFNKFSKFLILFESLKCFKEARKMDMILSKL